jgi:outer membrane lipoprotein carrier protein
MIREKIQYTFISSFAKRGRRRMVSSCGWRIPVIFSLFFFLAVFYLYSLPDSFASGAEDSVTRIQKAYEHIKDIKGNFVQKSVLKDLNRTDTYEGEFFIKPPLRMKWVYKGKTAPDVIINGNEILIYKKEDNQAYKGEFDRATYGQTPVALLSGFGSISQEFDVTETGDSLLLRPRKPMGTITSIRITLSPAAFPIRSFVIYDTYSNVIEITLKDIKINTGLKDSLFNLTPPKGANVYEQ